jgi:hypothetical protein
MIDQNIYSMAEKYPRSVVKAQLKEGYDDGSVSSSKKWIYAITAGFVFLLLSLPITNQIIGKVADLVGMHTHEGGCLLLPGIILHMFIFIIIARILMW